MRTFVITMPGLSCGKLGATVTAAQLRMDDDKLDAFVQAGFATELHVDAPRGRRSGTPPADTALADLTSGD